MVANQLFYEVINNKPELNVPNAIFRRLQLVWLCNILQDSLWNNDLGVLNDAYRILKAMEFPPDLEYSDEFLDLLVDFKTQLFIGNLMLDSTVYTDALQSFARYLQITDRDEKEAQIINKKWMAKCIKRKKDLELFAHFDKMVKAWPESKFLERIKSFLMIIGAYLNQKYPAGEIRRRLKNNALSVSNVEVSKSSDETSSVALKNDDDFVQIKAARRLPIGFSKLQPKSSHTFVNNHVDLLKADGSKVIINVDLPKSDSTDALNEYTSNEEVKLSQIRPKTVPISEYVTLFNSLKSLYSLDYADFCDAYDGTFNLNETVINNELVSLKKKLEVVYDGYNTLQKYLNFLKDTQRTLENKLQSSRWTSNELPWTDEEDENDSDKISRSQQNAKELEKLSEQETDDGENDYKHLETQEYADEDNEIEDEELVLSDEEDELFDDDTERSSYPAHLTDRFMVSSSPTRSSRRISQKTSDAQTNSAIVQIAAYNGKDVYEIKCNNEFVLRRVSDGWVNASSILQASSLDEFKNALIERELPGPKESVKGSKTSKLRGIWVPVETARQLASHLDLDKELEALLVDDIRVTSNDDVEENSHPAKRSRNMENTEAAVLKTRRSPASTEKSHKSPATRRAKEKKSIGSLAPGGRSGRLYEATYSNIQVYEFIINDVSIMRRKRDSWVNGTHILKAAGVDKGKRTKILEKEVHHEDHEKVQGGYGRYQGTWIPLERARILAHDFGVAEALAPILDLP